MNIIVGVDESASAESALRWALRVAARAGASVEVVRSWAYSPVPLQQLLPAVEMDRLAEKGVESSVAGQSTEGISIRTTVLRGPAHHALLRLIDQRRPALVVVGRRGGDERTLPRSLGSVSRRLVDASPCPVAVVSIDPGDTGPTPVVMVAVDGSAHSERAFRWALNFARLIGGRVLIAHVIGWVGSVGQVAELTDQARAMLDRAVDEALSQGVEASTVTEFGDPRRELERIADEHAADLIVVGPRGIGGITKLVLGTVAAHLSEYAARPVVVVPTDSPQDAAP